MEEIKRQRRRSLLILGAALLLIVTGTVLINRVINLYSMMIQEDKDADHMDLTYSLDQNIAGYIERYSESLAYVVQRRGFQSAGDIWKSTGDTEELLFRLNEKPDLQPGIFKFYQNVGENMKHFFFGGVHSEGRKTLSGGGKTEGGACAGRNRHSHEPAYRRSMYVVSKGRRFGGTWTENR